MSKRQARSRNILNLSLRLSLIILIHDVYSIINNDVVSSIKRKSKYRDTTIKRPLL